MFVNVDRLYSVSEVRLRGTDHADWFIRLTDAFCLQTQHQREFEEAWGVKVFDRYSVVLHIFRCNARTKEAKLQISLAEIPLLR